MSQNRQPNFTKLVEVNYKKKPFSNPSEADDFSQASQFLDDNFIKADIVEWDETKLIELLKRTHAIVAKHLLQNRASTSPAGSYRNHLIFVLRKAFETATNSNPMGAGAISKFMAEKKYPEKEIKSFLIAFQKFFFMQNPSPSHQQREPVHRNTIKNYAQSAFGIKLSDDDFKNADFTLEEKQAFSLAYKIFIDDNLIENSLTNLANKCLTELKLGKKVPAVCAQFFIDFIEIHPFSDGNGRLARLFANAILYKFNLPVINFCEENIRKIHEDDSIDANPSLLIRYIAQETDSAKLNSSSFFQPSENDLAHARLVKSVEEIIPERLKKQSEPFVNSINEKNYARALRIACTSLTTEALRLVELLFEYKDALSIDVNEQAGPKRYSALHQAALKKNRLIYEFLIKRDEIDTKLQDADGHTASFYYLLASEPSLISKGPKAQ